MEKFKMLFARLLLTVMLSCTLISDVSFQTHDAPQASITVHAAANYNQATIKKVQKKLNSCGSSILKQNFNP